MTSPKEPVIPIGHSDIHLAAHLFNPVRLTLARELRGLTKAELAASVGKSPAELSQFEMGRHRPDSKTIAALTLALGVPLSFLVRQTATVPLSSDACHFRSLRSASQRERRKLLSMGTLLCDLIRLISEHIQLPKEQLSRFTQAPRSMDEIEKCAVQVRREWGLGLGPIPNITKLLEAKGVLVTVIPDGCAEVEAFSVWHDGKPIVFLVPDKTSTSRVRYDAAHELGHLIMHADVAPGSPDAERQANRFAAAFMVPREPFLMECPRRLDWGHFYELKRRWRMSVAALVKRAFDLGALTEASYRRAFIHLNRTGERFQELDEPPVEQPELLLRSISLLSEDFSIEDLASRLGLSSSDLIWLVRCGQAT